MGRKAIVSIGDVFQIPLSDGRKGYGQYVFQDKNNGSIIRVFDYFTRGDETSDLSKINIAKLLFPPIYASIFGMLQKRS